MNRKIVAASVGLLIALTGCTTGSSSNHPFTAKGQHSKTNTKTKAQKAFDNLSTSQKQAVGAAQDYLQFQAFSQKGLIQQLSSKAGDGYAMKDAVFAATHIKVDWNAQAVKSAKDYLKFQHFSCAGLVQQLSSAAGDQFTLAQAQYAGKKVGLC